MKLAPFKLFIFAFLVSISNVAMAEPLKIDIDSQAADSLKQILTAGNTIGKAIKKAHLTNEKYPVVYLGEYHGFDSYAAVTGILQEFPTERKCVFLEGNTTLSQDGLDFMAALMDKLPAGGAASNEQFNSYMAPNLAKYFSTHQDEQIDLQRQMTFSDSILIGPYLFMATRSKVFTIDYNFREVNEMNDNLMAQIVVPDQGQRSYDELFAYHYGIRHKKASSDFTKILNKVNCDIKIVIFGEAHLDSSGKLTELNSLAQAFHPIITLPIYETTVKTRTLQSYIEAATKLKSFVIGVGIKDVLVDLPGADVNITVN